MEPNYKLLVGVAIAMIVAVGIVLSPIVNAANDNQTKNPAGHCRGNPHSGSGNSTGNPHAANQTGNPHKC
jgi:hypothetical protein